MYVNKTKLAVFKSIKILACAALLSALSIAMGKYLQIPVGNVMRFSLENTPIILGGMLFGPFVGMFIGAVADLVGCLMVGYDINIVVTLGAASIGFVSGLAYMIFNRFNVNYYVKIIFSVIIAHIVGSVVIKTIGLAVFYDMKIYILMLWRLLNYVIVGAIECLILGYLLKNKAFLRQVGSIKGE